MSTQSPPHLRLKGFDFAELFLPEALKRLDQQFLDYLGQDQPETLASLLRYRGQSGSSNLSSEEISALLIACAPVLGDFVAELFGISEEAQRAKMLTCEHQPIFEFKAYYVHQQAKRQLGKAGELADFEGLDAWLDKMLAPMPSPAPSGQPLPQAGEGNLSGIKDRELAIAQFGMKLLEDPEKNAPAIEKLIHWCIQAMTTPEGQRIVKDWVAFHLPKKLDYADLVPTIPLEKDRLHRRQGPLEQQKHRDGFVLTDPRMSQRQVLNEIDYCVYCHKNAGDFCSKGFPIKKADPQQGLKRSTLGEILTGCPLEEKISEMHVLKKQGETIAALAVIMVDNPMCPVTGHRICNDCMRSCIYQKQEPVDIPQTETGILSDVLHLPWGVEIYDLLTRWNPLRPKQWLAKPYNGLKIMVMGMGPAGFTLAHHLLMEGFAVVGAEGLKIEPLEEKWLQEPIYAYEQLKESLDTRVMAGFGGVAEYGITVRWDKNFLKLIYLSLLRRPYFQVFGGVRFGGTLKVEDVWELGFDHLALAVGAGLPKELAIPGSLAPGMRQANDFLMALQLTGAAKKNSLANLQVRLPAVVIGGGLTGVDTATEVQAYYIVQVEKTLARYEPLLEGLGMSKLRESFDDYSWGVLQEFLEHGRAVREERRQAAEQGRAVNFIPLLHQWGGVTIAYRRPMQQSPAYVHNYEEVSLALAEGVLYAECLSPSFVKVDADGYASSLLCERVIQDEAGGWVNLTSAEKIELPARAIFVATGARPNVAYEFEHEGTFQRQRFQYQLYEDTPDGLEWIDLSSTEIHCKTKHFGPFTSYLKDQYRVSILGDSHPVFHGNVVKAIASGKRSYPAIVESLGPRVEQKGDTSEYQEFARKMQQLFVAQVLKVSRLAKDVIQLDVLAPMASKNFQAGQFYRVQNYETQAQVIAGTRLQTEGLALLGTQVNKEKGSIRFVVMERGASSRLFANFRAGDPIAIMGPSGVRTRIPDEQKAETILIICDRQAIPYVSSIGSALKAKGSYLRCFMMLQNPDDLYWRKELEAACDEIFLADELETSKLESLNAYAEKNKSFFAAVDRIIVTGNNQLIKSVQAARHGFLKKYLIKEPKCTASIYGPMQCMLKGVCAQCLQWQIDPHTGKRSKAVFTCSWQDQPIDIVDLNNLDERLIQNRMQEILSNLWLDYILDSRK